MFLEVRALFSDLKNRKNPQIFRFLGMKSTFFRFEKPENMNIFSGNYRGKTLNVAHLGVGGGFRNSNLAVTLGT